MTKEAPAAAMEWPASKVRETFIRFFEGKEHVNWRSSPVVPLDDPTLLFANAGMNQFKPIFLGTVNPANPLGKLTRACNTQKCIRAGGKHNDLDDVGKDTYHHTFFEMLGNWSFGDYFKREAISWAWELLTKVYKLPPDRIYATYFGGDEKAGLAADAEAKVIWLNFLPPERVLPFGCKDNFWEMGDTGPCGPCTEIHFDRVGNRDAASLVNNDDPTCIEIWNLVFIQFNREADGSLRSLPAKHVDTGMGFERLTSILQNKMSNYDTDVFLPIFDAIQQVTGACPYSGRVGPDDVDKVDMAYRVVADHIRTLSFAIADGSHPGNEGREYVLRRILRRAVRYGREVLKAQEGFFSGRFTIVAKRSGCCHIKGIAKCLLSTYHFLFGVGCSSMRKFMFVIARVILDHCNNNFMLSSMSFQVMLKHVICFQDSMGATFQMSPVEGVVVKVMGDVFPELKQYETKIKEIIAEEEASFGRTLAKDAFILWDTYGFPMDLTQLMAEERGLTVDVEGFNIAMEEARQKARSARNKDAFILWDTYGFPMDLTQLMAEERGLTVDVEGFNIAMEEARQKARSARNKASGDSIIMDADATSELHKKGVAPTDDSYKFIWHQDHESVIKAIYTGAEFLELASAGADVGLVLESTSFYAEQGGQIYDTGSIEGSFGSFQVGNVQGYGGFVLHIGSIAGGAKALSVGDKVICKVDYERRTLIAPNHTCTHMLNFALREVLGDHVDQKGSIVLPEKLRFDFSHGKPVHPEDLRKIESIVNQQIKDELDVHASEVNLSAAKQITGLRAVFGEIYPDPVRVVSIGRKVEDLIADPDNKQWLSYSTELCGGTHISNTRDAKAFALLSEEGIAKGIRRITAVTTECAFKSMELASSLASEISSTSKFEGSLLEKKVASLKSKIDAAAIPAAMKADLRAKISQLEDQVRKAKKKIGEQNIQKAIKAATEIAEAAASEGKAFCISQVDVGLDTTAVREAVLKVMDQKGLAIMVFSTDKTLNKAVVYAGVPESRDGLVVLEWLTAAMGPLNGKGGRGKNGTAQGQGSDASRVEEAMDVASKFASMKLGS
ncbi:Alanine--tRNA ligase [Cocos nucifera]|uniref:Alanine--tRNA ligase n=1 Tax=Cocos nucifera TaxID=13894 RepID=A0A8K0INR9_COCNU|nr:Alanine--tRNA ligase [Cocos nucifera]